MLHAKIFFSYFKWIFFFATKLHRSRKKNSWLQWLLDVVFWVQTMRVKIRFLCWSLVKQPHVVRDSRALLLFAAAILQQSNLFYRN